MTSTDNFNKQVLNPYPTGSPSYTGWEKGFIEGVEQKNSNAIAFAEFCGRNFYINDVDLWEHFDEGTEFEVNSKMQFRFTTTELYQVFLSQ